RKKQSQRSSRDRYFPVSYGAVSLFWEEIKHFSRAIRMQFEFVQQPAYGINIENGGAPQSDEASFALPKREATRSTMTEKFASGITYSRSFREAGRKAGRKEGRNEGKGEQKKNEEEWRSSSHQLQPVEFGDTERWGITGTVHLNLDELGERLAAWSRGCPRAPATSVATTRSRGLSR
ncbi:hypothetical protein DBV15_03985, partial [Temnothorax longispinosus]